MPSRPRYLLLLCLGGLVWGSLFGTFFGALGGIVYGLLAGDLGLGLDGAVLGCFALGAAGAVYGTALGLRDRRPPVTDAGAFSRPA
jgi:hypothetical protein